MKTLTTLALVLATATSAAADTGAADANLPKEVQQMYCMVGDWTAKDAPRARQLLESIKGK